MADTVALKESFSVALNSVTNMEELEKNPCGILRQKRFHY